VDSQSAREQLAARLDKPAAGGAAEAPPEPKHKEAADAAGGGAEAIGSFLKSRQGKALQRQVMRGVFGMLRKKL
jgi:DNA double-strand break repair helicase HerA and related ATPase